MSNKSIHDQILPPSKWTVTGVDSAGKASLSLVEITEKQARRELAGYFTEMTAGNGAIAGHATCVNDPEVVLYFGIEEAAVLEHMDRHQFMQAAHRNMQKRGFGK